MGACWWWYCGDLRDGDGARCTGVIPGQSSQVSLGARLVLCMCSNAVARAFSCPWSNQVPGLLEPGSILNTRDKFFADITHKDTTTIVQDTQPDGSTTTTTGYTQKQFAQVLLPVSLPHIQEVVSMCLHLVRPVQTTTSCNEV